MTPRQQEIVEAYQRCGTKKGAARALGLSPKRVRQVLEECGAARPLAVPLLEPVEGQVLKGTSTLIRPSAEESKRTGVLLQWVKDKPDESGKLRAFEDAVEAICRGIPAAAPVPPPDTVEADLLFNIPIGDSHVGMLSWAAETGRDWDLLIAERSIVSAICAIIDRAPKAAVCRFIQLGDFFHADDQSNTTARSGHQLDVDSRWARVLEVGMRILVQITDYALAHFAAIEWDMVRGNHDEHSAIAAGRELAAWYRLEPRVTVDHGPSLHHHRVWGNNLICSHHGHTASKQHLQGYWAQHPDWGGKIRRWCYMGHLHKDWLQFIGGMAFEHINAMCPADAFSAGGAFGHPFSLDREIRGDTWHKTRGRIRRDSEMIHTIEDAA